MFDAVVLNEASLPFKCIEDCERNIEIFFDLLHEAQKNKVSFSRVDEIEGDWNSLNYADNFIFNKWLDSIEDHDRRVQIKSVITSSKCPLLDINNNKSGVDTSDTFFLDENDRDLEVLGLAFAHLNNSHSLSLASHTHWLKSSIRIVKSWYVGNEPNEEKVDVPNISSIQQLNLFLDTFRAKRQENKDYLNNLKVSNNDDFENLLFTESALKSFRSSSLQPLDFRVIVSILESLNQAITLSSNIQELSNNSSLTISGESKSTMADKSLVRMRRFKHPTLGDQVFEPHIKNFTNGKRMHILANYKSNTICIGYFGKHLKTSSST